MHRLLRTIRLGTAYTPGLTISADHVVRRTRRLPLKGDVLVQLNQEVEPTTVVARTELPGILQSVKVAEKLSVEPGDVPELLTVRIGDSVEEGVLLAESKGLFGIFKGHVYSEYAGTIETLTERSGHLLIREPPTPVEVSAYMKGKVVEILPEEGAIIETRGAMIQGIFGIGGERLGAIRIAVESPDETLEASHVREDDKEKVLIGGACVTFDAIKAAEKAGVVGLVAGAVRDMDLVKYLGYDIGVAITGQEAIPLSLIATEGFGRLAMASHTFELFKSLEGKQASINGATQIRAGVIRPEVIVPIEGAASREKPTDGYGTLEIGTTVRIIREPYFGRLAEVTELPPELQRVESGSSVRVLKAKLEGGEEVTVPRANVEIIAT